MQKVIYNNEIIEYEIVRAKLKRIYIKIKDGKLIVKAPRIISKKELEDIVLKKASWILKHKNLPPKNKTTYIRRRNF